MRLGRRRNLFGGVCQLGSHIPHEIQALQIFGQLLCDFGLFLEQLPHFCHAVPGTNKPSFKSRFQPRSNLHYGTRGQLLDTVDSAIHSLSDFHNGKSLDVA
jgi:hypothetical protein